MILTLQHSITKCNLGQPLLMLMPAFCDVPLDRRVKISGWKSENPDEIHFLGYVKESLGSEKKF